MEEKMIRVAITHGDTNGIGYEVILKAFDDPVMLELCTPIIYGSPRVAAYHRKALEMQTPYTIITDASEAKDGRLNLLSTFDDEVKVELGVPTDESHEAARKAMARAKEDLQKGLFDVLVMAPVRPNPNPPKEDKALTVLQNEAICVGLLTTHLPIKDVPQAITTEKIVEKGKLFHLCLKRDFRVSNPRIAVLALNPRPGKEETEVIAPAIEQLEKAGVQAFGPYVADDFFGNQLYDYFDGVLAMYDDQGIVPFKTITREYGVKLKTGITAICTTPDHGPAFDIAGKGLADPTPMRHAIYTAVDLFRNRHDYDAPLVHPLPKLFHEKREDGEKVRFAIPKSKEKDAPK